MNLALYQPDIAANTGSMMRLCACFGVPLDIIEPCGFVFDDKKLRRAGMDYIEQLQIQRHASWNDFRAQLKPRRLILLSTKADTPYHRFSYRTDDVLMVGRESAGVPDDVHAASDARILIPMRPETRSLNVAMSAAIVLAEALRQTDFLPK